MGNVPPELSLEELEDILIEPTDICWTRTSSRSQDKCGDRIGRNVYCGYYAGRLVYERPNNPPHLIPIIIV